MLENLEISALKLPQKPTKAANTTQVGVNTPRRTFNHGGGGYDQRRKPADRREGGVKDLADVCKMALF